MKRMAKPGYDVDILPWNVVGRSGVADELGIWSRLFMRTRHQGLPGGWLEASGRPRTGSRSKASEVRIIAHRWRLERNSSARVVILGERDGQRLAGCCLVGEAVRPDCRHC